MATATTVGFPDTAGPDTTTDRQSVAKSDITCVGLPPLPSANWYKLFEIRRHGILGLSEFEKIVDFPAGCPPALRLFQCQRTINIMMTS